MSNTHNNATFAGQLRSLVLTTQTLSEYASEVGDARSSAILDSVAALLETALAPHDLAFDNLPSGFGVPVLFEHMAAAPG